MYFNDFPQIKYDCTGNGNFTTIQDIMTRIKVRDYIKNNGSLFSKYTVDDGETPEMIAFKLYGDVSFHWVVLLFNQIINTYYDWPLSTRNFQRYVTNKYVNPQGVHHYQVSQSSGGDWIKIKVESDVAGAVAVTNLEYEATLQDKKREIRILQPQFLGQFQAEFGNLLEEATG